MLEFLTQKTPDERNKWWTLFITILAPLPFLLLLIAFAKESFDKGNIDSNSIVASLGLLAFLILWPIQIIKGTYKQSLKSSSLVNLYKITGWSLIFLFVLVTNLFIEKILQIYQLSFILDHEFLRTLLFIVLSFAGWKIGLLFKGDFPGKKYSKKASNFSPSPHQILETSILGLLGYMILAGLLYFIGMFL